MDDVRAIADELERRGVHNRKDHNWVRDRVMYVAITLALCSGGAFVNEKMTDSGITHDEAAEIARQTVESHPLGRQVDRVEQKLDMIMNAFSITFTPRGTGP